MRQLRPFGQYVLHLRPLQLWEGEREVKLTQRQLKVLALLVEAQGRVVSQEVFLNKIWSGSAVEESNLTQTVFLIRRALGTLPNGGAFIETLPRKGYRLSARALHPEVLTSIEPESTSSKRSPYASSEEERFRLFMEAVEDYAFYLFDGAGRLLTRNPGARHCDGYSQDEIIGKHHAAFFVPEDIDAHLPERELAIADRQGRYVGAGWRIRKGGERFWASFTISPVRDVAGKLVGFAKIVQDTTERKYKEDASRQADALVRRERDLLRALAESSMDACYVCEPVWDDVGEIVDFVFTFANRHVERLVAVSRDALLGSKMSEALPGHRRLGLFEAYRQVMLTGDAYVAEFPVLEGEIRAARLRVHAVRFESGVAVTVADVSYRSAPATQAKTAYVVNGR